MPEYKIFDMDELQEEQRVNHRKLVQRNVETYANDSVAIHELLQNSIDAIQKNISIDTGRIEVTFDLDNQRIEVQDNGSGFPHEPSLLLLGGTDKDQASTGVLPKGNLGVGLKAVYFSSDYFSVESITGGLRWGAQVIGGSRYLEESPTIRWDDEEKRVEGANQTLIRVDFPGQRVTDLVAEVFTQGLRALDVSSAFGSLAEDRRCKLAFEWYFRPRSYSADLTSLFGKQTKPITIRCVIRGTSIKDGSSFPALLTDSLTTGNSFEVSFPAKYWDVDEFIGRIPPGIRRPTKIPSSPVPSAGNIGKYDANFVWIRKLSMPEEYASLLSNPGLRSQPDPDQYESLFSQLNGIYIVIGARDRLRDVQCSDAEQTIAVNGVPSAHDIATPQRGGLGYIQNIQCIIDVDARFNIGKQTITNPRLIHTINQYFDDAYRATLKNIARSIVGRQRPDDDDPELPTDYLGQPDLMIEGLGLRKLPTSENMVIALFFGLLGAGLLRDYNVYHLSGKDVYDGKFRAKLSNQPKFVPPSSNSDLQNIEFKYRLSDLIRDFESETKDPRDVTLAVVWEDDFDSYAFPTYTKQPIDDSALADHHMDRVTQVIHDSESGRNFQVLVLESAVAEIIG